MSARDGWTPEALASALGDGWSVTAHPENADNWQLEKAGTPGLAVWLDPYGHKGRALVVCGRVRGFGWSQGGVMPEATTALDRGPEALAQAIRRRVLPEAAPAWAKAHDTLTELKMRGQDGWRLAEQVQSILDGKMYTGGREWGDPYHIPSVHAYFGSARVEVNGSGDLKVEGLSRHDLLAVVAVVREMVEK